MLILKILFWTCVFIVLYTYIGYGILLYSIVWLKRRWCKQDHAYTRSSSDSLPSVTLMICAYNEEEVVEEKMRNTLALDYPRELFTVMWVTDGSSDRTNELLGHYPEVKLVFSPERKGKTAALHHGMGEVKSDIVVFTDANTMLNEGAIREMVRWFDDPHVGCVSGEKRVAARHDGDTAAKGEGLYWKYESALKRWDSELYSAMGAAGELYAIRRELYREVPSNALLDDFMMSMGLVAEGYRIAYTSNAYAMEYGSANLEEESKRKRRIAAGGLQSVWWLRQLMNPFRHPKVAFQFVSHRVLRWSVTPFALLGLIPLNVILVMMKAGYIYLVIWLLQILFYLAAWGGYWSDQRGKRNKLLYIPYYFLFMNINVFHGISYLRTHRHSGAWEKAKRG